MNFTRLARWTLTVVVLGAVIAPAVLRADEPTTRPARGERRFGGGGGGGQGGPEGGRRMGPPPGQMIEQFRNAIKDLNLTDEQKTKVEAALKTAAEDFKALRDKAESMEPKDRRDKFESILGTLRKDVGDTLTDEQRQTLKKKMSEQRPGGPRPGLEGTGPTTRPGQLAERLERFHENIAKVGLTDDQKKKIDTVLADAKPQFEEIKDGLMSGEEDARAKARDIMDDVRRQIGEILTPEQRDKMRELMASGPRPPGDGAPRDGMRRRPGGPDMKGDEMMDEGGGGGKGDRARQRPPRGERLRGPTTGPAPGALTLGSRAPDFELKKLDGKPVQLSSFHGRVGVIVFGSYSSPSFRQRAAGIEALARQFGSRAQFLVVYTKEANPTGQEDVQRNKEEGISVEPHKDAAARLAAAEKAKSELGLTVPVATDTMDDAVATSFGGLPNGAVVLSRDGVVVARQQWLDTDGLERRIEQALKVPTSKPAL